MPMLILSYLGKVLHSVLLFLSITHWVRVCEIELQQQERTRSIGGLVFPGRPRLLPMTSSTYHPPWFWCWLGGSLGRAPRQCEPSPTPNTLSTSPGPPASSWWHQQQSLTPGGAPHPPLWLLGRLGSSTLSPHGDCLWEVPPNSPWCWWSWGWASEPPGEGLKGLTKEEEEEGGSWSSRVDNGRQSKWPSGPLRDEVLVVCVTETDELAETM